MSEIIITIHDSIWSQINRPSLIKPCLQYKKVTWKQGPWKKTRKEYTFSLIEKEGLFYTGFLPRVSSFLAKHNIPFSWKGELETLEPSNKPSLKNFTLRNDQNELISSALEKQRGVLVAPTGIGKTVLAMGILSCFKDATGVFTTGEKTLLNQTYEELRKEDFKAGRLGGSYKEEIEDGKILVATPQSLSRRDLKPFRDKVDIIFVDECDVGIGRDTQLTKILTSLNVPFRIGLTATPPVNEENKLYLEGLIGPTIGELTREEAITLDLLAKPHVRLLKTYFNHSIRELQRYPDVYQYGIVENASRNLLIAKTAKNYIDQGKTILIVVTKIEHGELISSTFKSIGLNIPFIQGKTEDELRIALRNQLNEKKVPCVIATTAWKRGINIPTLDIVINGAGEKSETALLQRIGRGFRRTEDKNEFLIIDIFDPSHPYLISHFGFRVTLYMDEGWL